MTQLRDMYHIGNEMKKIWKKVDVLNRKKERFGLNEEEEEKLQKLRSESYILNEELIESHIDITVMSLLDEDYRDVLRDIQKVLPWNGRLIRRDEDYEKIANIQLTEIEKEYIEKRLYELHVMVIRFFEVFCSTEGGWEYMVEVSKVITKDDEGNILDLLAYLDARYRELAEMLDIELDEVWIDFEEGGENEEIEEES